MLRAFSINSRLIYSGLLSKPLLIGASSAFTGGGIIAGVTVVELTQNQPIYKKLKEFGEIVVKTFKPEGGSSPSSPTPIDFYSWISWIPGAWSSIISFLGSVFEFFKVSGSASYELFKDIPGSYETVKSSIPYLQKTFSNSTQVKQLFTNLHQKVPSTVKFFTKSSSRQKFMNLFTGEKMQKSIEAFKVLSGSENGEVSKVFKVEEGVLLHLVNKFAEDPDLIVEKIERLTNLINSSQERYKNSGSDHQSRGENSRTPTPYTLDVERLDRFLKKREETAQNIYELGVKAEIGLNNMGLPVNSTTSAAVSVVTTFLGWLASGSS